ncbi:GerAB/ArcD/ProY family transporter [Heyndrickxia sp. NPDC080065]|uniref:GerAB/ArcD/ProY family transporter n=1 Tax=Heyndrickxia sp. NPDC080065 TaxID=3390568 RepID=UPI003D054C3C
MEKAKITAYQLFVLIFLFEQGSALVVSLGTDAKQDTWLSIFIAMIGGLFLYLIYYRLYLFYPDLPLTSYVQKIIGPFFGKLLGCIYLLYFFYIGARILRDFGELLLTFAYPNTPIFIIMAMMTLTIMYAVHKGFEVLARTGEIYFILIYFLAISGAILLVSSGLINLNQLKPVLEEGFGTVINVAFKQSLYIPFGEVIVFSMILPYLSNVSKAKLPGLLALALCGINLAITDAINVAVLGEDLVKRSAFPLLSTIQKIQVANFLERLDVFFMLFSIIGGFFKIGIFFYAGVTGTADLFKLKNYKKLIYPLGLVFLFLSMSIASNFSEQLKEGLIVIPLYIHLPLQIIIPLLLLMIAYVKNRKKTIEKNC